MTLFGKLFQWIAVPLLIITSLFAVLSPVAVYSQDVDVCETFGNCLTGTEDLADDSAGDIAINLILGISYFLIFIGVAVAVLYIVLGGYNLVTSGGDDSKAKSGRQMVTNAVIGLVLIIVSVTIVQLVANTVFGLDVPGLFGGSNTASTNNGSNGGSTNPGSIPAPAGIPAP